MTVTYTADVTTCGGLGCFRKLIFRWRGSVYKLIWFDVAAFLIIYYVINLMYAYLLSPEGKNVFEILVQYCNSYSNLIPLSFVLGFYLALVMQRWWSQYTTIPWPDPIAVFVSAHVHGDDERARVMRRTVMRYVCLCLTMVMKLISSRVNKRFPTYGHLVEAGLMQESERVIIEPLDELFPNYPKHWMPIVWATSIITRARREGKIREDYAVKTIIDEMNKFRGQAGFLLYYDWVSVPLIYTQVVTLAVYTFFLIRLIALQYTKNTLTDDAKRTYESQYFTLFPIFSLLQFFFYMGLIKTAETVINPFGDDDDDFELNWMIDRNLQVSYLIVDEMNQEHPELVRDQYWEEVVPSELPYADENQRQAPPEASTTKMDTRINPIPSQNSHFSTRSKDSRTSRQSARSAGTIGDDEIEIYQTETTETKQSVGTQVSTHELLYERASPPPPPPPPVEETDFLMPSSSVNFEDLIEERKRERHERTRNRFQNMRSVRFMTLPTIEEIPQTDDEDREVSEEGEEETTL